MSLLAHPIWLVSSLLKIKPNRMSEQLMISTWGINLKNHPYHIDSCRHPSEYIPLFAQIRNNFLDAGTKTGLVGAFLHRKDFSVYDSPLCIMGAKVKPDVTTRRGWTDFCNRLSEIFPGKRIMFYKKHSGEEYIYLDGLLEYSAYMAWNGAIKEFSDDFIEPIWYEQSQMAGMFIYEWFSVTGDLSRLQKWVQL